MFVAKKIFLTKGVRKHREKLTSFEITLHNAKLAPYNLVRVSSIFPPKCKIIPKAQGIRLLHPGQIVFCVMSENATNEPHRLTAATVGVAVPTDPNSYGYLSEHHSYGQTDHDAGEYAEELAAEMLATTLDVDFDPNRSWDEKKEIYRISNKIVKVVNITQSAIGDKKGLWTTVVAGAVFIPKPFLPE